MRNNIHLLTIFLDHGGTALNPESSHHTYCELEFVASHLVLFLPCHPAAPLPTPLPPPRLDPQLPDPELDPLQCLETIHKQRQAFRIGILASRCILRYTRISRQEVQEVTPEIRARGGEREEEVFIQSEEKDEIYTVYENQRAPGLYLNSHEPSS